ncbi:hypothetical protein QFC22_000619 [Naganishia vaughanmartiniae]|uniref:Uncharacterized protein n=1 Tax=Naganishia vaughanmartiniae TaxID=1424756 RepID=A0ACC2XSI3_9TREE|nr:hypothetical protein QFC22_000619 [Naganishia vaughanmartiniae]
MSDTSSPLTAMSSPLSELDEPVGSPEPFFLPPPLPLISSQIEVPPQNEVHRSISQSPQASDPIGELQPIDPSVPTEVADIEALFQDRSAEEESDDIILLPGASLHSADVVDLATEPELIRHGNITELRWLAGPGMEEDLVVEVDENGYEIVRNAVDFEIEPVAEIEGDYDDLVVEGEKGVRSLLDCCRGIMMRCAARYDDIGDLQYQQHPLFFNTMSAKQLEEIEANSPSIKNDTDHLWKRFVMQKSLVAFKSYDENRPPKSWRKMYKRLLREEERKMLQAAEEMKARYAAEEMEKRAKRTQITTATLNDLGYRRKPAASVGSSRGKATSLLGKVREKTVQDRKFRAPPSIQAIPRSAIESLVFPTSGPFATLGAFEPTSRPKTGVGTSKRQDLPAPPFINPNHVIQQTISQASAAKNMAKRNGIVASTSKVVERAASPDDSDEDEDEVHFVAASSKTKTRTAIPKNTLEQKRKKPPEDADPDTAMPDDPAQPVDMDFFSVPMTSASISRPTIRRISTPQEQQLQGGQRVLASPRRPESSREQHRGNIPPSQSASVSGASGEGSQRRVQSPLFVPKRRKVY